MVKLKLLFVLFTNIKLGYGTETALLQYLRYFPRDKFEITVLQSEYAPVENITNEILEELEDVNFLTIKSYFIKFNRFVLNGKVGMILKEILTPFYFKMMKFLLKNTIKQNGNFDCVYLFENNHQYLFDKKDSIIIGSTHCWAPHSNSIISRINTTLIANGLMWRNIKAFHLLPGQSWFSSLIPKRESFTIANGVNLDLFMPTPSTNGRVKILYNSRLEPCKGVDTLIDSLTKFNELEDYEFIIIGAGSSEKKIQTLNLQNVKFLGGVKAEELYKYYGEADIFVAPTTCDTFSLVVAQALSAGTPCIVGKELQGTYDEFEKIGFVKYINQDPLELKDALMSFVKNLESLKEKIPLVRKVAEDYLNWSSIAKNLEKHLLELT